MSTTSPPPRSTRPPKPSSGSEVEKSEQPTEDSKTKTQTHTHPPRFHDMDSLRAAMMLLGIVFHAAWFFVPVYYGHTLSDVEGAWGYSYFFGWVHEFRMQTFFLIAGFFACLLIQKRGTWSFAKNRGMRIVLPLLLCMLTLWPLMKLQYLRGGLISGRIISDEPLMTQYWNIMTNLDWTSEWLLHFWFLYTLIWLYVLSLCLKLAFELVLDRSHKIRPWITQTTNRISESHLGPFVLAVPVATLMAIDLTWFGIYTGDLIPAWNGVFAYWIFFAVGWCMYARPAIIDRYVKRWPSYLAVGSILALVLCGYYHTLLLGGKEAWGYPALTDTQIDYPQIREKLLAAAEAEESSERKVVWNLLEDKYKAFVREQEKPTSDQLAGFTLALSIATVLNEDFLASLDNVGGDRKNDGEAVQEANAKSAATYDAVENRERLEAIFSGDITPFYIPPMWIRVCYFYGYCLATWLLIFAMLGMFRQFMSHPSPTARYLADPSYWLFLIHLPIQFELSLYIAQWEANSILKFLIYNLATFAIAIPTYHFLVRSTWLGLLLNGRLYPLKRKSEAVVAAQPKLVAATAKE